MKTRKQSKQEKIKAKKEREVRVHTLELRWLGAMDKWIVENGETDAEKREERESRQRL